jgi:hypothetical protein
LTQSEWAAIRDQYLPCLPDYKMRTFSQISKKKKEEFLKIGEIKKRACLWTDTIGKGKSI